MKKMVKCKTCNADIAASAKVCPACGAKNKPPVFKRVWFWVLIAFVIFSASLGAAGSSDTQTANTPVENAPMATEPTNQTVSTKDTAFSGDCGITASAEMGLSIIGYPELSISISNATDKDISAIKFYAVPYNVYGEEITGWTSQNNLYTDTTIPAGGSNTVQYQFIENSVKTVKLYVYSVYFSDGTEWGNKDATKTTILKNGALIEVNGES